MIGVLSRPALPRRTAVVRGLLLAVLVPLALASWSPLFSTGTWLPVLAVASTLILGVGALARARGARPLVVLVWQVAAAVAALFAAAWVLEPESEGLWREAAVFADANGTIGNEKAPFVPDAVTLVALCVVVALVALTVDLVFVTLNLHLPTALALLAVAVVPMPIYPDGIGSALLGPVFACLIVLALRTVHADPVWVRGDPRPQAGPLPKPAATGATTAAAVLVSTLGIAVAPALVPIPAVPTVPVTLDNLNILVSRGLSSGGSGVSESVSMRAYLRSNATTELLRYETTDRTAGYLKVAVLPAYSDGEWTRGNRSDRTMVSLADLAQWNPRVDPEVTADTASTDVTIEGLRDDDLPVPYSTTGISAGGEVDELATWAYAPFTGEVMSRSDRTAQGMTYTVTSSSGEHSTVLDPRGGRSDVSRADVPERVVELADRVVREADAHTDTERAEAIQEYFQHGFTYDLETSTPIGQDPVDYFLTHKRGYCEQFAAAMALMAVAEGIPSRVVVGFTSGEQNDDGTFTVTNRNAHAWPELYISDSGSWTRFEPTPAGAVDGVVPVGQEPRTNADEDAADSEPSPGEPTTAEPTGPTGEQSSAEPTDPDVTEPGTTSDDSTADTAGGGSRGVAGWVVAVAIAAAGALVAGAIVLGRYVSRRRRTARLLAPDDPRDLARGAMRVLAEACDRAGVPFQGALPPDEALMRLAVVLPPEAEEPAREMGEVLSALLYEDMADQGELDRRSSRLRELTRELSRIIAALRR